MKDFVLGSCLALAFVLFLAAVVSLSAGCAVRATIQGCMLRCPDAMKTPSQIEAEAARERCLEDTDKDDHECEPQKEGQL